MSTKILRLNLFWYLLSLVSQGSYAQIDTASFPLEIGNRWYYRYTSGSSQPTYFVKTIIANASPGVWTVRKTILLQDSVTVAMESWSLDSNKSFYANGVRLYDSQLTHDSSWIVAYSYIYNGSIQLSEQALFGVQSKCQIRSTHSNFITFSEGWTEQRAALGIGFYYDHSNGYGGESSYNWTYELIAFLRKGKLYGDSVLTSVKTLSTEIASKFSLYQNFPNPFNPTTTIVFEISRASFVNLDIYNLLGQKVVRLVSNRLSEGRYSVPFDGNRLPSGIYLYRIETETGSVTKAMSLVK